MIRTDKLTVPAMAFVIALATQAGCGDSSNAVPDVLAGDTVVDSPETAPVKTLDEWIAKGKEHLANGEAGYAVKAFEGALAVAPDDTDAIFGKALSEMVYGSELFLMALSLTDQLGAEPGNGNPAIAAGKIGIDMAAVASALKAPPDDWTQNEYLAYEIHRIFMNIRKRFDIALDYLDKLAGRDLAFRVEAVPVYMRTKPGLMYRGVFDAGDVQFMTAVAATAVGICDTLAGQDLTTDVLTLVGFVKEGPGSKNMNARRVMQYAAYLLLQDDHFLTLHPDDGEMLFADARKRFAEAGPAVISGMDLARELGADDDQVTWVEDAGGQHVLHVRSRVFYDAEGKPLEEEMTFHFTDGMLQAFEDSSHSILTPKSPVTLHGSVIPILAVMLSVGAQAGVLDAVGLELPIDLGAFETPGVVALLESLMPNVMAFDWGAFYETPVGLRAWLPAVTSGLGVFNDTVMVEWECPGDLDDDGFPSGSAGLLCGKGAEIGDKAHFVGSKYEMAADGIDSGFPVFAFDDPTLNGLALVDLDGLQGSTVAGGYVPADGASLNAALAMVIGGILELIP